MIAAVGILEALVLAAVGALHLYWAAVDNARVWRRCRRWKAGP